MKNEDTAALDFICGVIAMQFDPDVVRSFMPMAEAEMKAVFAASGTTVAVAL